MQASFISGVTRGGGWGATAPGDTNLSDATEFYCTCMPTVTLQYKQITDRRYEHKC